MSHRRAHFQWMAFPQGGLDLVWWRWVWFTYYPDVDRPGARIAATEEGEVLQEVTIHAPKENGFLAAFR